GQRNVALERTKGVGVYLARVLREFVESDEGEQRGVFNERNKLSSQRGQSLSQGLREDDISVGLGPGQSDSLGGFDLRFANAFDTGADDFGDIGTAKKR